MPDRIYITDNLGVLHAYESGAGPTCTVAISPASAALSPTEELDLSANEACTFALTEVGGGTLATLSSTTALYTAPVGVGTYHVVATSVASPSCTSTCTITVALHAACAGTPGAGYANPHTLPGTSITQADSAMLTLSTRVHRAAREQRNDCEAWYYRVGQWHKFPIQPAMGRGLEPQITRQYREPATARWLIPDSQGLLTTQNKAFSSFNYDQYALYDPILDAARKVLLRGGVMTYSNLSCLENVTSTLAPSAGTLARLTDGLLGNISTGTANQCTFSPASAATFDLTVDLGGRFYVRHVVIRWSTKLSTCTLPAAVEYAWSTDDVTYHSYCTRPVGGNGAGSGGDWDDDADGTGKTVEVAKTDLYKEARYIRLRITPQGAQTLMCDEFVVYGGAEAGFLGANIFTGYLGAGTETTADSHIVVQATDTLKKLADNYSNRLTATYGDIVAPEETSDILYSLLTGATYWRGQAGDYDAPWTASEIGWTAGANVTGFKWPVWQGQSNNMLGYCLEILHSVGMELYADGNGVAQIRNAPYRQLLPDRVFIADEDGNQDVWGTMRHDDDVNLRNVITVANANPDTSAQTGTVKLCPASIRRYGRRETDINDPIAVDESVREQIASYMIRDYSWRLTELNCRLQPDFETHVKGVYGIRASLRPSLYCKANNALTRLQELWSITSTSEVIGVGRWYADAQMTPYVAFGPSSPEAVKADPELILTNFIDVSWLNVSDVDVVGYNIYGAASEDGFDLTTPNFTAPNGSPRSTFAMSSFTNNGVLVPMVAGTQYWFFVTAVGANGNESVPSSVVTAVAGGSAGDDSFWTITDLRASWSDTVPPAGTGNYEYTFRLAWTSPPVGADTFQQNNYGFKHGEFRCLPAASYPPPDPTNKDEWICLDEWHGDRVPSLLTWDRVTVADLTFTLHFQSATNLSGTTVYFRTFTWQTTNGEHGPSHASNIVSVVIP